MIVKTVNSFLITPLPPFQRLLVLSFPLQMCSTLTQGPPHSCFGDARHPTQCDLQLLPVWQNFSWDISCVPWRVSAQTGAKILTWALVRCLPERQGGSSHMAAFLLFGSVLKFLSLQGETCL